MNTNTTKAKKGRMYWA